MNFNQRFRPRKFSDIVGLHAVKTTLSTLIQKGKLPNIIILHGDNGIGKTSLAYVLAHEIMCGCNELNCEVRQQLWERKDLSLSTNIHEVDLGKDRDDLFIDTVVDLFNIKGKKTIILDEIQNTSKINMTKFLKTMDNIDKETYLIICTTELYKLDNGIISRSEVFSLNPPTVVELSTHLEAICRNVGVSFDRNAIILIAKNKYRIRDALRTLETVIDTYNEVSITGVRQYFNQVGVEKQIKFLEACRNESPYELLFMLNDVQQQEGMYSFTEGFKEFLLNGIYIRNGIKPSQYLDEEIMKINEILLHFNLDELSEIIYRIENMPQKTNIDRQIGFVNLGLAISKGKLLKRLDNVEQRKAEIAHFEPELGEQSIINNIKEANVFTFDSESTIPLSSDTVIKDKSLNVDLGMDISEISNLFSKEED